MKSGTWGGLPFSQPNAESSVPPSESLLSSTSSALAAASTYKTHRPSPLSRTPEPDVDTDVQLAAPPNTAVFPTEAEINAYVDAAHDQRLDLVGAIRTATLRRWVEDELARSDGPVNDATQRMSFLNLHSGEDEEGSERSEESYLENLFDYAPFREAQPRTPTSASHVLGESPPTSDASDVDVPEPSKKTPRPQPQHSCTEAQEQMLESSRGQLVDDMKRIKELLKAERRRREEKRRAIMEAPSCPWRKGDDRGEDILDGCGCGYEDCIDFLRFGMPPMRV